MTETTPLPHLLPSTAKRPSCAPAPVTGAWRYDAHRRSRWALAGAMAVSAGFHAIVLFGFNRHAAPVKQVYVEEERMIALVMPDLKDLEEPEVSTDVGDESPVDQGLSVPMLADVPSTVDMSNAFVQQIDYNSLIPQQDLTAAKTLTIPTNISRGGKPGEGMGKIFDLSDLDRIPEPIVRVAPNVPMGLKQAGFTGKVAVAFVVDARGDVVNAYVVSSSDRRLDDNALLAIGKWKFRPGIKGGRKVNTKMMQPFLISVGDHDN